MSPQQLGYRTVVTQTNKALQTMRQTAWGLGVRTSCYCMPTASLMYLWFRCSRKLRADVLSRDSGRHAFSAVESWNWRSPADVSVTVCICEHQYSWFVISPQYTELCERNQAVCYHRSLKRGIFPSDLSSRRAIAIADDGGPVFSQTRI